MTGVSRYSVQLCKDGRAQGSAVSVAAGTTYYDFTSVIAAAGDGTYTFAIIAKGDGSDYSDSAVSVASAGYRYTAPVPTATATLTPTATPTPTPTTAPTSTPTSTPDINADSDADGNTDSDADTNTETDSHPHTYGILWATATNGEQEDVPDTGDDAQEIVPISGPRE